MLLRVLKAWGGTMSQNSHTLPNDTKVEASWVLPGGVGTGTTPEIAIVRWYAEAVAATMIRNYGIPQVAAHALRPANIITRGLVPVSNGGTVGKVAGPVGSVEEISAGKQRNETAHLMVVAMIFPKLAGC